MATQNLNFAAQVSDWAEAEKDRLDRIKKASAQELASIANNGVPVDTGFARASFMASTDAMPVIDKGATNKSGATASFDFGQITAVINGASPEQIIYLGWTAAYILPLEYGHSKKAPQGFARLAAMQWPAIVANVEAQAKARAG